MAIGYEVGTGVGWINAQTGKAEHGLGQVGDGGITHHLHEQDVGMGRVHAWGGNARRVQYIKDRFWRFLVARLGENGANG